MNDEQIYQLRENAQLKHRIGVAVAKAAVYVLGLPTGDGTGGTATPSTKSCARQAMASLSTNLDSAINQFVWYVVMNGDVQADATNDTAIEYVVNLQWPQLWA